PGGVHTTEPNVEILDEDFFIPQLNRSRRVWLYLPPDYATATKRYPVIYMQDGQNLFDVLTSFSGEWKVDESMNDLFDTGDYGAIVVGIDNGGGERINEYSPWINPNYGGGDGEAYADFLATTLKPYIDSTYRTLSGREYTAIAGSSLGANISMYAAVEHQDIFSKVGIFSPAFWFSDSSFIHLQAKGITQDLRVYFVAGQNESATIIADMMAMYDALIDAGQDESEMYFLSEPDGAHSEWFWAREYPDCYEWLFDELILADQSIPDPLWTIYPNPVSNYISIQTSVEELTYSIYSMGGRMVQTGALFNGSIDTSALSSGLFYISLRDKYLQTVYVSRFVKH
ncbi:MAG TPA: alpha/beta hydrolase-fold protein, partial [Saprospiraceae bacterium]|nr:alpha/beta hydrolase-fold protein [Saprospiraceae bacterium]